MPRKRTNPIPEPSADATAVAAAPAVASASAVPQPAGKHDLARTAQSAFARLLRSIDKLPARSRPGLIGVILFLVVAVAVAKIKGPLPIGICIVGIAGALVVMAIGVRYAWIYAMMVLAFAFAVLMITGREAAEKAREAADKVVIPKEPMPNAAGNMVASGSDSVPVSGNVRIRNTNAAVEGAFVYIEGYGAPTVTTDAKGYFEIRVPLQFIKLNHDSVKITVQTTRTEIRTLPFDGSSLAIWLDSLPAPRDEVALNVGSHATMSALFQRTRGQAQEGYRVRLLLDSVRTLVDGSTSDTYWRFDVNVNDRHEITIPQRAYDQQGAKSLLLLGGETTVAVAPASRLVIHIRGLRDAFIGVHQANGFENLPGDTLQPERPFPGRLQVNTQDPRNGNFIFYYTLIRRGTPHIRVNAADPAG